MAAGLALLSTSLSPAQAATISETEPNDSTSTANVLPLGSTMQGSMQGTSNWDYDHYAVDIPAAGRTTIDLRFPELTSSAAYGLLILDDKGRTVQAFDLTSGHRDGAWLRSQALFLPKGTFYLRLSGSKSWDSWGKQYSLTVTHAPGDVELEPNGSSQLATTLPLGTTIAGSMLINSTWDYDYYAIDVPAAGRTTIDLRFPPSGSSAAYGLLILDDKGRTVQGFDLTSAHRDGAWLRSQALFLPKGTFYLRLSGSQTWDTWAKQYTLKVTHAAGLVELEPNGSAQLATELPLGKSLKGSSLINNTWDYDYFYVDLSSAATLAVELTAPAVQGSSRAYELRVLSESQVTLQFDDVPVGKTHRMDIALPAGRSYLRVAGSYTYSSWGHEYTLKATRALGSTSAPTITGTKAVGKTVKASVKAWKPSGVTFAYQWLRDGKAIKGATKSSYKLTKSDAGKKISVKVTGSKSGYSSVSKTSKTVTVAKVVSSVKVTVPKSVKAGKQATITVGVSAATSKPTGTVTVTVNGKKVTKSVKASAKGQVSVKLPKISKKGSYAVKVSFKPSGDTAKSTSTSKSVTKTLKVT
ncbi:Ig-like domain-containing protein [Tessaracoccus caeni]|uniref:Ig-like domain-containing protein n=1 Tax=Tessaracoccus caeni TaxID=3031239 RepID=UPI0023DA6772|nr:Ig-like domain repeat protein [Tessaracoccus caeni]MDF1487419.1 Ig-like domain repeat protein [Tessaracoccus caeni]